MAQNYETVGNFGSYKPGSVLPEWAVERAGPVAELVESGIVKPTDKAVNVGVRVPEPKKENDPLPGAVAEGNKLREENERLARENKLLVNQVKGLTTDLAARDAALGRQTTSIKHLEEACADHQTKIDELELANARLKTDLEAATALLNEKKPKHKPATVGA